MTWTWLSYVIPAAFAFVAAVYSAVFANRARQAESEASRLRQLEALTAQHKFEMYEPMLDALGTMLTPGGAAKGLAMTEEATPTFLRKVIVYGSDEAVKSYFRFRTGVSHDEKPPTNVVMRLAADFLLAVRRDMAVPNTTVTGLEIIGMRISKLFDQPDLVIALSTPLPTLAEREGWTPPWANL